MALDLIIRGIDKVVGDGTLTEDQSMSVTWRKGGIVQYVTAGTEVPSRHLSGKQVPPDFVVVRTDATPDQVNPYMAKWKQDLDWTLVSQDTTTDRWQGAVSATTIRVSDGYGSITRQQAENYLLVWNISNLSFTPNTATGEFTIYDLATSHRFWDRDITDFKFSELSYDEPSGRHDIRIDYGSIPGASRRRKKASSVDDKAREEVEVRAEFVAQDIGANTIDFCVWRGIPNHVPSDRGPLPGDDMIQTLKLATAEELDKRVSVKRWRIRPGVVNALIAQGGYGEATPQELLGYLQDYCEL